MSWIIEMIKYVAALLGIISSAYDGDIAKEGLSECQKGARRLNKEIKKAKSIGEKQKLIACLNNIKSLRAQFKAMQKKGAGPKGRKETAKMRVHWDDSMSAFDSRIRTVIITNLKHKDPSAFMTDCKAIFKRRIHNALKKKTAVKVNAVFGGEFEVIKGATVQKEYKYFTTANSPIYQDTDLDKWFDEKVVKPILVELEEFQQQDSGWTLKHITNLGININKFTPQLGSSFIELPKFIAKKHACINVKNQDDACFAWAIVSALYPVESGNHSDRTSSYPHYSEVLKLKGIQFPMTIKQIPHFEKQNDISINVYILEKRKQSFVTLPTFLTHDKKARHVNLLLLQDTYDGASRRYHFCHIKNLSRLVSRQLSGEKAKKFFCDRCLHYFRSEEKLSIHTEDCRKLNDTAIRMPHGEKAFLKFKNFKNKEKSPFIVYADLESILKPTSDDKKYQEHIPAAVGYFMKCSFDDSLSFYRCYRGPDCMQWFALELKQLAEDMETVFLCPSDIDMTPAQEADFKKATHCHICEKPFEPTDKKVRDHRHLTPTNNYRGPAHEDCNLSYQDSHIVPVVFHNLSGYDAHFIIADIAAQMKGVIDLLPITKEKYISFTKHVYENRIQFRFIDSFRFMNSSMDKLASHLTEFPNLKSQFSTVPKEDLSLLMKKGVMPYDYVDSFERFDEVCLPPINEFYNKLEEKTCPNRLYQRAEQVWEKFNCCNLGEYVDLYMKTDILLLADVFEQFRNSYHNTYDLDPSNYYTLPGFTWDAMLKYTKQELELLTDVEMFLFVEKGIRGGLSQVCAKKRSHANNKYLPNHDSTKPNSYLMYYDINNQYGWSMIQHLTHGSFEWADTNVDVTTIPDNAEEGYILEVDLEYPTQLHDKHKDLPFCAQHIDPRTGNPPTNPSKLTKLMATLHSKEKYVIHYRALKLALNNGLLLTKIHRVLKFKQSLWLKSYIDLNTKLRTMAKNDFEKNLFKLMNNAVFGKTMENIRKRVNFRLLTEWSGRYGAESYISKPEFKNCTIFNENLVAVELRKLEVVLNKPIYVGMSILDLAKTTLYDFHYGYMAGRYGEDCSILYTDTDSLIYELAQDPYEVMRRDCHTRFDTSDYPRDNPYEIPQVNKKVIGLMKDETNGVPMTDFVGLRSKLYTFKVSTLDDETNALMEKLKNEEYDDLEIQNILKNFRVTKKVKGLKRCAVENHITFDDFIDCLESSVTKTVSQNLIRSSKHKVFSIKQDKIAPSYLDDKRHSIIGTYETLPLGHYSIMDVD